MNCEFGVSVVGGLELSEVPVLGFLILDWGRDKNLSL